MRDEHHEKSPGIVEHGLFLGYAKAALIASVYRSLCLVLFPLGCLRVGLESSNCPCKYRNESKAAENSHAVSNGKNR
jgi:hypothetical protein